MTKINLSKEHWLKLADSEGAAPVSVGKLPDNCIDCAHHQLAPDPDPTDWFCADDVAVLCRLAPRAEGDQPQWSSQRAFSFRTVTVSCRPHRTRQESVTPDWCPLRPK